jgi:hypothetical protein
VRVKCITQFTSQVPPPWFEKACSQRADIAVILEIDADRLAVERVVTFEAPDSICKPAEHRLSPRSVAGCELFRRNVLALRLHACGLVRPAIRS